MRNHNILSVSMIAVSLLFASCGGNTNESAENTVVAPVDTTPINEAAQYNFLFTIGNLPSPFQVLTEVAKAELPVNTDLLNPTANVEKYRSSLKLAFNYGIYGVDLGYLVINSRLPEMVDYYSSTRKVADKLNLAETFDKFGSRFESNSGNKDSLTKIIDEAYGATDNYLKSNERLVSATEILTGSWLEGQYLTVNLLKTQERSEKNEPLYQRIYEQGLHLDNIIKTIEQFQNDKELMSLKKDFDNLLALYKELHSTQDVTKEYLEKLSANIAIVRNQLIN